jgi:ABC-type multidrug transport system fused ATPase/permease subunit
VRYGKPDATDEEVHRACVEAEAADFIAALPDGYDTCVGQAGTQLSGGQKQRIAIARCVRQSLAFSGWWHAGDEVACWGRDGRLRLAGVPLITRSAIIRNPKIMLLDEATSALDAHNERLVKVALERVMVGRTTLVVAHRLSTIRDADKICVLDGGAIVEQVRVLKGRAQL